MTHDAHINGLQKQISVASQLYAALIHVQMAEIYAQTAQPELASNVLKASIEQLIEFLPDSCAAPKASVEDVVEFNA